MRSRQRKHLGSNSIEECGTSRKSEILGILCDAGLPQGLGVEWLFDYLDQREMAPSLMAAKPELKKSANSAEPPACRAEAFGLDATVAPIAFEETACTPGIERAGTLAMTK